MRSSGGVQNPGRFLVGRPSQAHTMGMIPCWMTSFPPAEKKKNEQKKLVIMSSTSNIIYWDEQCQMFYPSSFLFMYSFIQGGNTSIISWNIHFGVPIWLCMTEPEGFHCLGIYTFVWRTVCLKQIEYQSRHLDNTKIRDIRKKDFSLQ